MPTRRAADPSPRRAALRQQFAEELATSAAGTMPSRPSRTTGLPACDRIDATAVPLALVGGPLLDARRRACSTCDRAGRRPRRARRHAKAASGRCPRRSMPSAADADPLAELADAYFDAIPDAFRRPNDRLYEWLGARLAAAAVRGIIFRRYVWCDLWHAELQRLQPVEPRAGAGNRRRPRRSTPERRPNRLATLWHESSAFSGNAAMNDDARNGSRSTSGTAATRSCARPGCASRDYGGPLRRHVGDGDLRLLKLRMDNSAAALRLWNFLLTEEDRLRRARGRGQEARRHDEGPRHRAGHGLLAATTSWPSIPTARGGFPA